jgi:hypothetical protein
MGWVVHLRLVPVSNLRRPGVGNAGKNKSSHK